ncbi:MAG: hypothetical protein WBG41_10485, partial [Acidimicrobiales bacterium]
MTWAYFAVSLAAAVLVVNAYAPIRREPATTLSFVLGWTPSELPVHFAVLAVGGTIAFATAGAISGWPGWTGLALSVAALAGLC